MNLFWKILLGVFFWDLVEGSDEVLEVEDFQDLDFDEMDLE